MVGIFQGGRGHGAKLLWAPTLCNMEAIPPGQPGWTTVVSSEKTTRLSALHKIHEGFYRPHYSFELEEVDLLSQLFCSVCPCKSSPFAKGALPESDASVLKERLGRKVPKDTLTRRLSFFRNTKWGKMCSAIGTRTSRSLEASRRRSWRQLLSCAN